MSVIFPYSLLRLTDNGVHKYNLNEGIDKPTVICLCGNATIKEKYTQDVMEMARDLMGLKSKKGAEIATFDDVNIIGITYGKNYSSAHIGNLTDNELDEIVDSLLLPLCLSSNGEKLDKDLASKRMNRLTFFSHCHGAVETYNLLGNLYNKLINKGFLSEEIHAIYDQCTQISFSPIVDESLCPVVKFFSAKDPMAMMEVGRFYKDNKNAPPLNILYSDRFAKFGNSKECDTSFAESIEIFSKALTSNKDDREHGIKKFLRNESWELVSDKVTNNLDISSQLMGYSLCWSVSNSINNYKSSNFVPKESLKDLHYKLNNIKEQFQDCDYEVNQR